MRHAHRSFAFVLAALLSVSREEDARAQLLVTTTPGEPPAIAHAELAYAAGEGPAVTWLSLRIARGPVALVAALPTGALADAAPDAWFTALEGTTSPNVLFPPSRTTCRQESHFVHVAWPRAAGVAAEEVMVKTPDDVAAILDEHGLQLETELPQAERYLIWSWPAADTAQTTRTLRIVGGATPLTLLPGADFPLLVSSVTSRSAALPTELSNRELAVTFVAKRHPATDYIARLRDWLAARPEPLLEMRARGPLFDWSIYDDGIAVAPLVSSYATRAAKEISGIDADACAAQLRALRDREAHSAAACGDASDASLALSAAGSELATLQRFAISGTHGFSPVDASAAGVLSAPVLRAQLLDDSSCSPQEQPPLGGPPRTAPVGNAPGSNGTTTVVGEETVVVDDTDSSEVSCGGSSRPDPDDPYDGSGRDSCASDTSSSSESESSDSCSGDSSSSTDPSHDSGCSSDTSSSDTSSDSGCASDSSSSGDSTDSGCSSGSDESSGYDGDTCTGAAAPGGERTEKARASLASRPTRRRPRRLRTSLWSMAFAAFVLPLRRRKRAF